MNLTSVYNPNAHVLIGNDTILWLKTEAQGYF